MIGSRGDLAGFQQHLQSLQFLPPAGLGIDAPQLGSPVAGQTIGRTIGDMGLDLGAAPGRGIAQLDLGLDLDIGAFDRPPGQGKALLRVTVQEWGPIATGGFPPGLADKE